MDHTQLNFINNSNDKNNSQIVIYGENSPPTATSMAVYKASIAQGAKHAVALNVSVSSIHIADGNHLSGLISLKGLASADIVMTGGGSGTAAQPFKFTLMNMKPAAK